MHKKTHKRGVFSPLTQKTKAPQHLARLKDCEDDDDGRNSRFQLPSIQRRKSWKDIDTSLSSCSQSAATSVSWPEEMEEMVTCKVFEQWDTIERTLFEEQDQLRGGPLLEECTQWKTQVPHLRVVGNKSVQPNTTSELSQPDANSPLENFSGHIENDEVFLERTFSGKSIQDSTKSRLHKEAQEEIYELLVEYINSELFPNKENETDALSDNLSEVLRITPAPIYSDKSSKDSQISKSRDRIQSGNYYEDRCSATKNRMVYEQESLDSIKYELETIQRPFERRNGRSVSANKHMSAGNGKNSSILEEKINTPPLGRNKLGTVFNERIVVSPVPYILSTRESFCTLRTTPIKYIGQSFDISSKVGSGRNVVSGLRTASRRSGTMTVSSLHSAWQAPVCPTVWPKNVKLAPIDISRLPSSKNRTPVPSPATLHRNRKPLSPISRTAMPSSTHAHDNDAGPLEIQGKHIVMGPSSKRNLRPAGWDYSPRINTAAKKKVRAKSERQ